MQTGKILPLLFNSESKTDLCINSLHTTHVWRSEYDLWTGSFHALLNNCHAKVRRIIQNKLPLDDRAHSCIPRECEKGLLALWTRWENAFQTYLHPITNPRGEWNMEGRSEVNPWQNSPHSFLDTFNEAVLQPNLHSVARVWWHAFSPQQDKHILWFCQLTQSCSLLLEEAQRPKRCKQVCHVEGKGQVTKS